jgi:hypothetical protein
MKIEKRWVMLLVAVVGVAVTTWNLGRRRGRVARDEDLKSEIKSWENEGGNLAPSPATSAPV